MQARQTADVLFVCFRSDVGKDEFRCVYRPTVMPGQIPGTGVWSVAGCGREPSDRFIGTPS